MREYLHILLPLIVRPQTGNHSKNARSVKDPSDSPSCKYRHDKISEDGVIRRVRNEHIQNENKYVNRISAVIKIKYCF